MAQGVAEQGETDERSQEILSKEQDLRELDRRADATLEVALSFSPDTKAVYVELFDKATNKGFIRPVAPEEALDRFIHPYSVLDER